ncbi:hypothetical protein ACRAWF_22015 [Streptomyces sp. L7]
MLLVVRAGKTRRVDAVHALDSLAAVRARVLGAVLTGTHAEGIAEWRPPRAPEPRDHVTEPEPGTARDPGQGDRLPSAPGLGGEERMTQDQMRTALFLGILALLSLIPGRSGSAPRPAFGDWDLTSTLILLAGESGQSAHRGLRDAHGAARAARPAG